MDREVGRLLRGLEERGYFEDTAILVVSDHGEEFFEHGMTMHKQSFDECLRVPFLLRPPGGASCQLNRVDGCGPVFRCELPCSLVGPRAQVWMMMNRMLAASTDDRTAGTDKEVHTDTRRAPGTPTTGSHTVEMHIMYMHILTCCACTYRQKLCLLYSKR